MRIEFTAGGTHYTLMVASDSRRASEAARENIRPDRRLWTSAQKKTALRHRTEATAREIHAAGARGAA